MTVVARRIASIPKRTSVDTWRVIADLLADPGGAAHNELLAVTNVVAMLIADENTRDTPIIVTASAGPRVRIYTLHEDSALDEDEVQELPLSAYPTDEAEWELSVPCADSDLDFVRSALAAHPHVTARSTTEDVEKAVAASSSIPGGRQVPVEINLAELERP